MVGETKIDEDFKDAFNLGHELAKELTLKSPMFNDSNVSNDRMVVMQAGMAQYTNEISQEKGNNRRLGLTF